MRVKLQKDHTISPEDIANTEALCEAVSKTLQIEAIAFEPISPSNPYETTHSYYPKNTSAVEKDLKALQQIIQDLKDNTTGTRQKNISDTNKRDFFQYIKRLEKFLTHYNQKKVKDYKRELKRLEDENRQMDFVLAKYRRKYESAWKQISKNSATIEVNKGNKEISRLEEELHKTMLAYRLNPLNFSDQSTAGVKTLSDEVERNRLTLEKAKKLKHELLLNMEEQLREKDNLIYAVLSKIQKAADQKKIFEKNYEDKRAGLLQLKKMLLDLYEAADKTVTFADIIQSWQTNLNFSSKQLTAFTKKLLLDVNQELVFGASWEIAVDANHHASDRIKKGTTQLENNELLLNTEFGVATFKSIAATLNDVRNFPIDDPFHLASDAIYRHETIVKKCEETGIGNCGELARLALDYILKNSNQRAEIFSIKGGDHAFVVVSRKVGSDPKDPSTWGPNALIIDPWSKAVYKAADYRKILKNFVFQEKSKNGILFTLENFDPKKQSLLPVKFDSTDYLRAYRDTTLLKANYEARLQNIKSILNDHKRLLVELAVKKQQKYGETDEKSQALQTKLQEIKKIILKLDEQIGIARESEDDYSTQYEQYRKTLKVLWTDANKVVFFNDDEAKKLFAIRNKGTLSHRFRLFFDLGGKTENKVNEQIEKTVVKLSKLL